MTNITVPNKLSDLPVLKLCTKGLSERTTRTMAVFIERQLAGVCELVPGDLADAVLIDLDAQGAFVEHARSTAAKCHPVAKADQGRCLFQDFV